MILKNNPERTYSYVKKNMHKFIKDGKIHINYEIWVEIDKERTKNYPPSLSGLVLTAIQFRTLITTSVTLKQDIYDVANLKGFQSFCYYNTIDQLWDDLIDRAEDYIDNE